MIGVAELVYDIDLRLNKVATSAHQAIAIEDKIIALNDAQLILLKRKIGGGNGVFGLDSHKRLYDDLQRLVVPHARLAVTADSTSALSRYTTSLSVLRPRYLLYVDCYFVCSTSLCGNHPVRGVRVKHADLPVVLSNSNTAPSFHYQELPVTVSSDLLEAYTDGSFQIDAAYVSYIKYPARIDVEGYIGFDGAPTVHADAELPYYLKEELVSTAVELLAVSTENQPAATYAISRNQQPQ